MIILALCEIDLVDLISSEALLFENQRVTNASRSDYALEVLQKAKYFILLDEEIKDRARELSASGIMALDALHLASAEKAQADFFCTCDDKLLKKAKPVCEPQMRIVSPVQFLEEVENDTRS